MTVFIIHVRPSDVDVLSDLGGTPKDWSDDEFLEFVGIVRESTGLDETHARDFCEDVALFTS